MSVRTSIKNLLNTKGPWIIIITAFFLATTFLFYGKQTYKATEDAGEKGVLLAVPMLSSGKFSGVALCTLKLNTLIQKFIDPEYKLIVGDNGAGLPEDLDINAARTPGLQLVTSLAEYQLKGQLELDRNVGSRFHIKFREVRYKKRI